MPTEGPLTFAFASQFRNSIHPLPDIPRMAPPLPRLPILIVTIRLRPLLPPLHALPLQTCMMVT